VKNTRQHDTSRNNNPTIKDIIDTKMDGISNMELEKNDDANGQ
jgi:hypothetical protein